MTRPDGRLSPIGVLLERLGGYLVYETRRIRQEHLFNTASGLRGAWAPPADAGVIYDVGANNGDDTAYYLTKGLKVVAIEANPAQAAHLARRFADEIAANRLVVLNLALTNDERRSVIFHVHRRNDRVSAIEPIGDPADFEPVTVPARRLSEVIVEQGAPFYVKIDAEGADAAILADLLGQGVRPAYISAEAQQIGVVAELVHAGYTRFKVIEGRFAAYPYYQSAPDVSSAEEATWAFSPDAAGPFGEDIPGEWIGPDALFRRLAEIGLGWVDIHAAR